MANLQTSLAAAPQVETTLAGAPELSGTIQTTGVLLAAPEITPLAIENGVRGGDELIAKQALARGIYVTWRNQHLGGFPVEVFNRIEAASAALVAAIAEAL